jgi:predicted nucleic acid-binding protein
MKSVRPSLEILRAPQFGYTLYELYILEVAAAMRAGCAILYREDLQQRQMIEKLQIRNPFAAS